MYRRPLSVTFNSVVMQVILIWTEVQNSTKGSNSKKSSTGNGGWHVRWPLLEVWIPVLVPVKEDTKLDRNPAVIVLLNENEVSPMDLE